MIPLQRIPPKSLEQILEEAMSLIPIYSREWSNYNRADPGVTILQVLASFHLLQQTALEQLGDATRMKLLELLGFRACGAIPATAPLKLISAEDSARVLRFTKFVADGLMFENTTPRTHTNVDLLGAYYLPDGKTPDDLLHIVEDVSESSVELFASKDAQNAALYIMLTIPPIAGGLLSLYVELSFGQVRRNRVDPQRPPHFSELYWELYTESGWMHTEAVDETFGLLQSGIVTLRLPQAEAAVYRRFATESWCLRLRAKSHAYDFPPRLSFLAVDVIPVSQRSTLVCREIFGCVGGERMDIVLENAVALCGCISVFCREQHDRRWRMYEESEDPDANGRFYLRVIEPDGSTHLQFHAARGFFPIQDQDAVRVVCCDAAYAHVQRIGYAYGYDDQVLETGLQGLVAEEFELMVQELDEQGEVYFTAAEPNAAEPDALHYRLDTQTGQIWLLDSRFDDENLLLISSCVTSMGEKGNLWGSQGLRLRRPIEGYLNFPLSAFTPVAAQGGICERGLAELRRAFVADLKAPYAAVTAQDYEELVAKTPALLIHKVKAIPRKGENAVDVVVKPHSGERFPALSPLYEQEIRRQLDRCRLIGTRINLVSPIYVPIDLTGAIYVCCNDRDCREIIEQLVREELDYLYGDQDFGRIVSYTRLYTRIAQLACVEEVYELSVDSTSSYALGGGGADIQLDPRALCYLRQCSLKITPRIGLRRE